MPPEKGRKEFRTESLPKTLVPSFVSMNGLAALFLNCDGDKDALQFEGHHREVVDECTDPVPLGFHTTIRELLDDAEPLFGVWLACD